MQTTTSKALRGAALAFAAAAAACGGDVRSEPESSSGSGHGGATAVASSSSGGAGEAVASSCEVQGGVCVSLDLPGCPDGRVSVFGEGHACEDPENTGNRQCCLPPADACVDATPIDLGDGSVTITGDTSGATDEHPSLTCDSPHVAFSLDQGQLYFRFDAEQGGVYQFSLQSSFYGFVYVFPATVGCSLEAIEQACSSDGATGMISGIVNPGTSGSSQFTAPAAGAWVFAVDGDTSPGHFELIVTKQ